MWLVGITGRSGGGKSCVTGHYRALGYPCADGDAVSRQVCAPGSECLGALADAFGREILDENGALLRRKLADIAFADAEKTARLESITHPHILAEVQRQLEQAEKQGHPLFFMEGAAIVDHPFEKNCDRIIVVTSEMRLSISRIILRDGISKTSANRRLAAQLPEERLVRAADYVIKNNGSLDALYQKADDVLAKLLQEIRLEKKET